MKTATIVVCCLSLGLVAACNQSKDTPRESLAPSSNAVKPAAEVDSEEVTPDEVPMEEDYVEAVKTEIVGDDLEATIDAIEKELEKDEAEADAE